MALADVTLATGWEAAGYAGSLAYSAAWSVAALVLASRLGWTADEAEGDLRGGWAANRDVLAVVSRRLAALRGAEGISPPFALRKNSVSLGQPARLAFVLEVAAFGISLLAAAAVLFAGTNPATLGTRARWQV